MKTIALTILLSLTLNINTAFASVQEMDFELQDEQYVDDIPFETQEIVSGIYDELDTIILNEVDNSEDSDLLISSEIYLLASIEFNMEEEEYVDDIPFNTEVIFNSMVNFEEEDKNVIVQEFCMVDEEYVDDIPFDSKQLIQDRLIYPDFAKNTGLEGSASVCCKYDENGFLRVGSSNSSNEILKEYVVSVLEDISLRSGIVSLDKEYVMKFNFRSI